MGLFAAHFLVNFIDLLANKRRYQKSQELFFYVINNLVFLGFVTATVLWPKLLGFTVISAHLNRIIISLTVLSLIPILLYGKNITIALLLILFNFSSIRLLKQEFKRKNVQQLTNIRYVLENTLSDEKIMDGWEGIGVFRPHAYFYWMLHKEIQSLLTQDQKQQLLKDLKTGKVAPKFVNLDKNLIRLSPEITKFFEENYQHTGQGNIYIRKSSKGYPLDR